MAKVKSKKKIKRRKVTFALDSSGAKEVILMGDFNNWNPQKHPNHTLTRTVLPQSELEVHNPESAIERRHNGQHTYPR